MTEHTQASKAPSSQVFLTVPADSARTCRSSKALALVASSLLSKLLKVTLTLASEIRDRSGGSATKDKVELLPDNEVIGLPPIVLLAP